AWSRRIRRPGEAVPSPQGILRLRCFAAAIKAQPTGGNSAMTLVLGLSSGSSFDGIDAVIIDIAHAADGYPGRPKIVDRLTHAWPDAVAQRVLAAFGNQVSLFELCRLNYIAGAVYAEAALALLAKSGVRREDLEVVGYDGQTIYQEPPDHARLAAARKGSLVDRWLDGPFG